MADDKNLDLGSSADSKSNTKATKHGKSDKSAGPRGLNRLSGGVWLAIAVVALAAGIGGGILIDSHLLGGGSMSASGKTTLAENQLDDTVATMVYNGKTYKISARDAITATGSLDAAKKDDGSYQAPTADAVLSAARNDVLDQAVQEKGITVNDDEVKTYAKQNLGTDDISQIASQYGLDQDAATKVLKQSAAVSKLRDQILGDATKDLTAPEAPAQPESGKEDTPTADYGKYIINLLGDEWDASKGTWAKTDGDYYAALGNETFSADSATYAQAQSAYYVAYQKYSQKYSDISAKWTDYVNGLLCNASISLSSLVA